MKSVLAILDPFRSSSENYNFHKDSSHLLLLELAKRGHKISYADPSSLFLAKEGVKVRTAPVSLLESEPYFSFHDEEVFPTDRFSLILMRKDPPVDLAYFYATQLLSLISQKVLLINHPKALRDWNEKLVVFNFPRWIPPTLVTANKKEIDHFVRNQGDLALVKPLAGFAGKGVKKLTRESPDYITTIEEMTLDGTQPILMQAFLPRISQGEKRVFMIDGKPLGALLKIPAEGSFLANPDLGAHLAPTKLTVREKKLVAELAPFLKKNGIFFAGIDLIDEKLIEINITSPGLLWEWNEVDNQRHEVEIVNQIERKMKR
jgi:glutathione synthase